MTDDIRTQALVTARRLFGDKVTDVYQAVAGNWVALNGGQILGTFHLVRSAGVTGGGRLVLFHA
jgi:hypothetical protein